MGNRWDFLDEIQSLDLSDLTSEQAAVLFSRFDEEERKRILDDLANVTSNVQRRQRAINLAMKIGEYVIEKGLDILV